MKPASNPSPAGTTVPRAALDDGRRVWPLGELHAQVQALALCLAQRGVRVLATLLDNTAAWVVADLAAAQAAVVHVPLPAFFTAQQCAHALRLAGVDALLATPALASRWPPHDAQPCEVAGQTLSLMRLPALPAALPAGTVKVSFTSGTTAAPKGVCLGRGAMQGVAESLGQATQALGITRHLCALPFAVLLENIAGLDAPLARGATCIVLPLRELGWQGSSAFDAAAFDAAVLRHRPHSLIVLPQMLRAWSAHLGAVGRSAADSLRLVAVGGAVVGAPTIAAARAVGIPAYEGYGLSEASSVQTLNLPGHDRPGSAGRPLPYARVRVAADGELELAGSLFLGYLGAPAAPSAWWPSGDLGHIDADGFVHVTGRKKSVLVTAFGRNVSPEWVEIVLCSQPALAHAVVLGDAQPRLGAVVWPVCADLPDAALQDAIARANRDLPDYARIGGWMRARGAFTPEAGLATANGRPRRSAIEGLHAQDLFATSNLRGTP